MSSDPVKQLLKDTLARDPNQPEFYQAVVSEGEIIIV